MRTFEDIIAEVTVQKRPGDTAKAFARPIIEAQDHARRHFVQRLCEGALNLWSPGDPIACNGTRIIVGVAPESRYDMQLLDRLNNAIANGDQRLTRFDLFDFWASCRTQADLDAYLPGLRINSVFATPVFGRWVDGELVEQGSGPAARARINQIMDL